MKCWRARKRVPGDVRMVCPPASPMLRVNAVPGYIPLGNHSRGGSPPSSSSSVVQASTYGSFKPSIWSSVKTLAPAAFTRSHSSRLAGQHNTQHIGTRHESASLKCKEQGSSKRSTVLYCTPKLLPNTLHEAAAPVHQSAEFVLTA